MIASLILAVALVRMPVPETTQTPLPTSAGGAVIINTGSTNTVGYQIAVEPDGTARALIGHAQTPSAPRKIPASVTHTFFEDLKAAQPFSGIPTERCMKSASFGTKTFVRFHREVTPDLSCVPTASSGERIYHDALAVARYLPLPRREAPGKRYLQ